MSELLSVLTEEEREEYAKLYQEKRNSLKTFEERIAYSEGYSDALEWAAIINSRCLDKIGG